MTIIDRSASMKLKPDENWNPYIGHSKSVFFVCVIPRNFIVKGCDDYRLSMRCWMNSVSSLLGIVSSECRFVMITKYMDFPMFQRTKRKKKPPHGLNLISDFSKRGLARWKVEGFSLGYVCCACRLSAFLDLIPSFVFTTGFYFLPCLQMVLFWPYLLLLT